MKAPTSIQRNNPVRKTTRKSTPSVAETQTSTPPIMAEGSSTRVTRKSVNAKLVAEHRYESFSSREIIPERSVDLNAEDTWGFLDIIKKGHLERIVTGLVGYIPEIVKEFYAALPREITRASMDRVEVTVRGHRFEFSPTKINEYLNLMPLSEEEVKADEMADALTIDELAEFLTEGTLSLRNLTTRYLSPCKAALVILSAYNWVPSSHKNAVSADRARLIYKMFHGIRVDNQEEAGEAEKKAQKQTKKRGKSASTSTASPTSEPPPSTPRSERTDPSGYVQPRQSPWAAGKFQIIHLGSVASPGQPIDAEEAKLALDMTSEAIQQLATAMQTLTSVVGQIASMLFPMLQKEGGKKDKRWLILPRTIFGNQEEAGEAEKKAQKQTKKRGKSASTSTASPTSEPPPSTPRSERTDPSGYVQPRQSPWAAGKFQIIHLGSVASPGQPIDAEEAKLALDMTSEAIQQLATAMQTLTSVVGQIASMLFPRVEEEADDPQPQDGQEN
ncbi:hypothetical protein DY000_02026329 [Brassica cretica]|uniref:Putative plant transposon protein domain-containing protein n=1 Tax=Brassica cretica TaxID=69181 RepID=A0ABQ7EEK9_BRACR|nr:hypothetical protein DY000_02026329 [Brassica cretica]